MPVHIQSFRLLLIALAAVAAILVTALIRRIAIPRASKLLFLIALILFALAAGGFEYRRAEPATVSVMVDLSASTRGASYRDRATLNRRIAQLLGRTPHQIIFFSDGTLSSIAGDTLADLPSDRTGFRPFPADAIILFSDGQFDLPAAAPPVFPIIDTQLEHPPDAAIVDIQSYPDAQVLITLANQGSARLVTLSGGTPTTLPVAPGHTSVVAKTTTQSASITARLPPSDLWPENDSLTFAPPPLPARERWWVSESRPPSTAFRSFAPNDLPSDPAAYLLPSAIILDDVPADGFSTTQLQRLEQYVRDLGGGIAILGGRSAFAAGGYPGTSLDALSPLASHPPTPTTRWIILTDSSGSMNSPASTNSTRLEVATSAVAALIPSLPPDDDVSLGSFARDLRWWIESRPARSLISTQIVPSEIHPTGPTNLSAVLEQIAASGKSSPTPTELILITDAEAQIPNAIQLAEDLKSAHTRIHLLAIREVDSANLVRQLITQTGGTYLAQADPKLWAGSLRQLFRSASPPRLMTEPVTPTFTGPLASLTPQSVNRWNLTWSKPNVTILATTPYRNHPTPMIALWNLGQGKSLSAAYHPDSAILAALVDQISLPPHDPGFKISWNTTSTLHITIDAQDNNTSLNDLEIRLIPSLGTPHSGALSRVGEGGGEDLDAMLHIPQSAPGRYELTIPAPRIPTLFTLTHKNQIIDRRSIPGRYPAEFDHIGNNIPNLNELARRTGGRVIRPTETTPLHLAGTTRRIPLTSTLSITAAILIAAALLRLRRG